MKKLLFLLILLLALSFELSAKECSAFFVGFGATGGADNVVKQGQDAGLIPLAPGTGSPGDVKKSAGAETVWQAVYDCGGDYDDAYAIALDIPGNVYVTGKSYSGMMGDQCLTVKYDPDGKYLWKKGYFVGMGNEDGCGIAVDASRNVYVAGRTFSVTDYNYLTIKYNSDSPPSQVWLKTYASPGAAMDDYGNCIALGRSAGDSGCVYTAGYSNNGTNFDFHTVKYDNGGNAQWSKFYDSGRDDRIFGIATDNSGSIYVAGWSLNDINTSTFDYLIIKYDSDSPPVAVWQKRYDGGNDDRANAVAVDASGNVYVTGYCTGAYSSTEDYLTIKYDLNGDTVWKKFYDGGSNDRGQGIAVDDTGNVYVTGYSYNGSNNDYFTIKYDSIGNVVWQKKFDRQRDDCAYAIVVDASNYVYVTGQSANTVNADYVTIKYRQY